MMFINGKPVNPLTSVLSLVLIVGSIVAAGFFLLPVIGVLVVIFGAVIVGLILYGWYWKWRYGDPVRKFQEEIVKNMNARMNPGFTQPQQEDVFDQTAQERDVMKTKTGIKRTTTIDDAVIVDEVVRR